MVFVTYYDLRAAERARERLQGSEISGRPIDVHYSLPRDDNSRGVDRDKNQQLQGTLQVTLRNSPSGAPLDDGEVRRKFQQFGDVKTIKPVGDRSDSRYVEFYDIRACEEAFDRLRHQGLQDGVMDIVLAWDNSEPAQGQPRERGDEGAVPAPRRRSTLVAAELARLRAALLGLLGAAHPALSDVARCCAGDEFRPRLVLLFAHATNGLGACWPAKHRAALLEAPADALDTPLTRPDVLNNWHPSMPNHTASFAGVFHLRAPPPPAPAPSSPAPAALPLLPTQRRLAQIVEMIHIASVLHDDVHNTDTPDAFGNKLSILAGDFLLGRASAALSRLGEAEVVELIASVIANQAEGEMLRVHDTDTYLRRTYLKTASLMAKGACASVVLGGCSRDTAVWKDVAYAYGRNVGIAYQLAEDILAGPARARVTGPVLFAAEEHPELRPLIRRGLAGEGDVDTARDCVARSRGVERTRALALSYAAKAREALGLLPESEHKSALDALAEAAVARTW
ncbi:hypothetical protein C0993_011237 [Termitomyces sp. T159_Od127]|nr:hypothetical protein C0993_011237 [Termitomyces sp. T159_Od127]